MQNLDLNQSIHDNIWLENEILSNLINVFVIHKYAHVYEHYNL